jgi:hypothetical protein
MKYKRLRTQMVSLAMVVLFVSSFITPAFSEVTDDSRKALLIERVTKYYEDRIHNRMSDNYDLYDPFFRAKVSRRAYEGNLLEAKFISYKIGDVSIDGNIAKVTIEIVFEIPETQILGQKISVPQRNDKWVDDWVWLDNNWFKVYKMPMNRAYIPLFPSFPK